MKKPRNESGIHGFPPPVETSRPADPYFSRRRTDDGRISWPTIVQYEWNGTIHDYPPSHKMEPVKPTIAERIFGLFYSQPRTPAYRVIVHNQASYEILCRTGMIYDARHTGVEVTEPVDNRRATQ